MDQRAAAPGTSHPARLRVAVATPLPEELADRITTAEPRVELLYRPELLPPQRFPADFSGDPAFRRTPEQQHQFERLLDSAEALYGIPDVSPEALRRTATANPSLRWVHTMAAGGGAAIKAAQLPAELLQRIVFTTSAGVHGASLAEFAVLGLLAGAKGLPRLRADQRAHRWPERYLMRQLSDLTVLVAGLGGIGTAVVERLRPFGCRIVGTSRSGRSLDGVDRVVAPDQLADAVGEVDAVVSTLPGTDATRNLFSANVFAAMKAGTILVNVGRGSVLDEAALLAALDDGTVGFAALDVFATEPLPVGSPLWEHPRVLVSPHTAALTATEEQRIAAVFAGNATALLDGQPLRNRVNTVDFY